MDKPLQIAFKDTESSEFLERSIRERVDRLERFHSNIIGCRVVVSIPHRGAGSGKNAISLAVEVDVPGHTIVGKEEQDRREMKNDQIAVITRAFDAVHRQLDELSDIRQGEVKQHDAAGETALVVRLFPEQDYGFVEVKDGPNLYFTRNAVVGRPFEELEVGTLVQVTRATSEGPMGPQASSVRLLDAKRSSP
ncbi:MAG: raiA ribosome-associated inhibitor A [Alphaproteobacteria bacterium]|nr:MAG: raiA ribosome-associated inhibitor A [Alphaproteobacteria bacterium]